ncbi:hypothetical protein, partial [Burkholderia stagnalis]|uniref:hypothetical protein n=1 Tax=Burkholderia stagnalis TaxID=1503054 RepID=UPI0011CF5390
NPRFTPFLLAPLRRSSPAPLRRSATLNEYYGPLSPILHTVPMQLLAYHAALARGTDIDKPRNLAKSVTVE